MLLILENSVFVPGYTDSASRVFIMRITTYESVLNNAGVKRNYTDRKPPELIQIIE